MVDVNQALQSFLAPAQLEATLFPPTSRYHGVAVKKLTRPDGREVAYLARRFVPQPEQFEMLEEYAIKQGDRVDNLAYRFLGDPEQFWRLCDANTVMNPAELTSEIGRRIRITLP